MKEEKTRVHRIGLDPEHKKLNKGKKVLLELLRPWRHTGCTIVANAFFASVKAAKKFKQTSLTAQQLLTVMTVNILTSFVVL